MAHDEKRTPHEGSRGVPIAPPFSLAGARPPAQSDSRRSAAAASPVSWAINELRADQEQAEPSSFAATTTATATATTAAIREPARPTSGHEPLDAPRLTHRRAALRPAWSPAGTVAAAAEEPQPGPDNARAEIPEASITPFADPPTLPPPSQPPPPSSVFPTTTAEAPEPPPVAWFATQPARAARGPVVSGARDDDESPSDSFSGPTSPPLPLHSSAPPSAPLDPPRSGRLWLSAIVALPLGLVGGLAGSAIRSHEIARLAPLNRLRPTAVVVAAAAAPSPAPAPAPAPSAPVEVREFAPRNDTVNTILSRIAQLADMINLQNARIELLESTRTKLPPELAEMQAELERLAPIVGELAPLAGNMRLLDERIKGVTTNLKTVREEMALLRTRTETPPAPATTLREPGRSAVDDPAAAAEDVRTLAQGIKLFKQNRFQEALANFNRLELSTPDDARVWYLAALSLGFSTNQWTGGPQQLVERGMDRERAGTPSSSVIDATFSDLPAALGRDWLAEYRRRAMTRPAPGSATPATRQSPAPGREG